MDSCKKPDMSKLITAYELGTLPEDLREAFEEHLMECDACFEELADMEPVATRLRERKLAPEGKLESRGGSVRDTDASARPGDAGLGVC